MIWRQIHEDELEGCLAIDPAAMGHESIGRQRALAAWRTLFKSPSFLHAAIESPDPSGQLRIVSFGSAVFVTDAFADQEVAQSRPGLNARIIASFHSGSPVVLNEAELRHANSCGGLHVVILSPSSTQGIVRPEQEAELNGLLAKALFQCLEGYRLQRMLREATSESAVEHMRPAGFPNDHSS
jgi:hypothetical protein